MQHGDLSNEFLPRWIVVFEGVLADVPQHRSAEYQRYRRGHLWSRAADCYELHPHVQRLLWDAGWRLGVRFDLITFQGRKMAEKLEKRVQQFSLPYGNFLWGSADSLAKSLAYMPDVQRVIHADADHQLSYGPRGIYVTDPSTLMLT